MTVKEKFIEASELYFPIDKSLDYSKDLLIDIKHRREYFIEGCECQLKQQDEFAIGFAEWLLIIYNEDIIYDAYSKEKLLEIYKEEKGL